MIEIDYNRLYINGIFICYATHQIPHPISDHCYISYAHRYGRDLINVAGKYWMGDNDGSLPLPDICIGNVVGVEGVLPDSDVMEKVFMYIQNKEDVGLNVNIKVK